MGGCYSVSSQSAVSSPLHKRPRFKSSRRSRKKAYYSQANSGDTETQQSPENGGNIKSVSFEGGIEVLNSGHKQSVEEEKGVAPSDSGIESLEFPKEELNQELAVNGDLSELVISDRQLSEESLSSREYTLCHTCQSNLQKISQGSCQHCGQFRIDRSALLRLVEAENQTYCTCGPRQPGKASTCRTHGGRASAISVYRHSHWKGEKLNGGTEGNHVGSNAVMQRCVASYEKGESGSSENTAVLQAPGLKDCRDVSLSEKDEGRIECDGAFLASKINTCHETLPFICKCDLATEPLQTRHDQVSDPQLFADHFMGDQRHVRGSLLELLASPTKVFPSGLSTDRGHLSLLPQDEDDDDSGHGVSKSENHTESLSDLELGQRTEAESSDVSLQSSPMRLAAEKALENMSTSLEEIVCPVMVHGRQMVMIDASTYTCMLEDVATLKEQLYNLTQVIQEEEMLPVSPLNLSLQMDQ